jgi:hypothetical protein
MLGARDAMDRDYAKALDIGDASADPGASRQTRAFIRR